VAFRACPNPFAKAAMLAMLALVLLFRTVPAGYMIAPSIGGLALTPCDSAAASPPAHHQGHEAPAKPKPPCAYAALAAPALPPAAPLLEAPSPPEAAGTAPLAPASIQPDPASLPPPSTGPPNRV
jgi:hypothetical protein